MLPGQARTYSEWAAAVKLAGGVATNMPREDNVPGARYPAALWVPKVNNHVWSLPDDYSADGQWGYYRAPAVVVGDAPDLGQSTDMEGFAATPDWYAKLKDLMGETGLVLAAGAAVLLLLNRRK